MKVWGKYVDYLLKGEWHIHTGYTDGKNTVFEYCQKASEEGIPLLGFTEHVRKNLDYDFKSFLKEIERARAKFNLIILSGCEAKVLPGGELDVEPCVLQEVDYPILAFHSFPNDIKEYTRSLKVALSNTHVNAWAHPGLFVVRNNLELSSEELTGIFQLMNQYDVLLEVNSKYRMPSARWLDLARDLNVGLVRGEDVHCVNEMSKSYNEGVKPQP